MNDGFATAAGVVGIIFVVVFIILLIIFGPILMIWSLNTLFPVLAIGYSIKTWFAALILGGVIGAKSMSAVGKKSS